MPKWNRQWTLRASQPASHCACVSRAAICEWSCSLLGPVVFPRRLRVKREGELPFRLLCNLTGSGSGFLSKPATHPPTTTTKKCQLLKRKGEDANKWDFPFWVKFHFKVEFQPKTNKILQLQLSCVSVQGIGWSANCDWAIGACGWWHDCCWAFYDTREVERPKKDKYVDHFYMGSLGGGGGGRENIFKNS